MWGIYEGVKRMSKLDDVIKKMNKQANEDIVALGMHNYKCERIPFTSPRMNWCTFGGLPVGKLIEFSGAEHSGKTTTALDIIANYQAMEGAKRVVYVDAENALDTTWAEKLGVNVDELITCNPTTQSAEEVFQFILDAVETGEVGLWVLDSIPALSSQQELDKDMTEKTYAGVSAALTVFSRKVEKLMRTYNCTGIGINQVREDMNSAWGGTRTPGGKGWKHLCSVRLEFSKGKYIDADGNDLSMKAESPAGNYIIMNMLKNRHCPPTRRVGFYTIMYEDGVDYLKDLVDLAIYRGIIVKTGAWYSIIDVETGEVLEKFQGVAKVYDYLSDEANEAMLANIEEQLDNQIG